MSLRNKNTSVLKNLPVIKIFQTIPWKFVSLKMKRVFERHQPTRWQNENFFLLINNIFSAFFDRPGSVEVTTVLTVNDRNNITNVERALHNFNQTGRLGSINLIGIFWKAEGEKKELCLIVGKMNTRVQIYNITNWNRTQKPGFSSKKEAGWGLRNNSLTIPNYPFAPTNV